MQAQVDLESDTSDSQDELSRAAILQAQADAHMVPTDDEGYEKIKGAKPKVTASYHAYPPALATYDQQSQSCGLFTQYENTLGSQRMFSKCLIASLNKKRNLARNPP
jgi:hypothetical protein